jgi:hypothetical protein
MIAYPNILRTPGWAKRARVIRARISVQIRSALTAIIELAVKYRLVVWDP